MSLVISYWYTFHKSLYQKCLICILNKWKWELYFFISFKHFIKNQKIIFLIFKVYLVH